MLRSAAVAYFLLSVLDAFPDVDANAPAHAQVMFDMKANGGSAAALGASRLRAIRKNSGLEHRSTEELAKQLDEEDDLVRAAVAEQPNCIQPYTLLVLTPPSPVARQAAIHALSTDSTSVWQCGVAPSQVVSPMLRRALTSHMTGWSTHVLHSNARLQDKLNKLLQYRSWLMQLAQQT